MKKLIALAIATSMCVMMIGCSGKEEAAATDTSSEAEVSEEAVEVEEAETEDGLLPDDTGGEDYIPEEEYAASLCLWGGAYLYKDYNIVTNEYGEDGSYYEEYVSEDGIQAVYEKGVMDYNTDIAMEDYMLEEATKLAGDAGVMNATLEQATYETDLSYPAYVAKFYSGNNEDTRSWIVYVVDTDNGLFMYGLSCAADYEDDMFYDADEVFPRLTISENVRAYDIDETGYEEGADLFDYLLSPVDDLGALIPELEQDGEQYSAKEEKAFDGLSLAGPFVDVNADNLITGITYGGTKYCVNSIWVGDSMEYAGQFLKETGLEFQSVDFAHGTAQYVVTYAADGIEIILVSDESGDFDKSEESDVTGCVATISCYYN